MSVLNWIEFELTTHPQTTTDRLGQLQDQINCFRWLRPIMTKLILVITKPGLIH